MGEPGKCPGSTHALAAWRQCCRSPAERRSARSYAPLPLRGAWGSRGRGHVFSVPSLVALTAPGDTTMGQGRPLEVGGCNQLQKTSPLFPTGTSKSIWQTNANVVTSKSCQFQQSGSRFMKTSVEDHYRLHRGSRK